MDHPAPKAAPKYRWITRLAGGFLVLLWLGFCAFLVLAGYQIRYQIPVLSNSLPTPTAGPVPTPHILVHAPPDINSTVFEDFSSNQREWGAAVPGSKVEVVDGKLILQSNTSGYYAIATNGQPLLVLNGGKYCVQADFTVDHLANAMYGLVFGFDRATGTFYLFDIQSETATFSLLKHTPQKWEQLLPLSNSGGALLPYPQANTLSIYFDQGAMELFINGHLVGSFWDKEPFQFGGYGAYLETTSLRLVVDNFFAYSDYK
ncbi:MAG TPA: hypothetical protein VLX61_07290 [Anaerolineales bacterium]|nr:hypothetical protein [Anaerolineales bacterium]